MRKKRGITINFHINSSYLLKIIDLFPYRFDLLYLPLTGHEKMTKVSVYVMKTELSVLRQDKHFRKESDAFFSRRKSREK